MNKQSGQDIFLFGISIGKLKLRSIYVIIFHRRLTEFSFFSTEKFCFIWYIGRYES